MEQLGSVPGGEIMHDPKGPLHPGGMSHKMADGSSRLRLGCEESELDVHMGGNQFWWTLTKKGIGG